MNPITTLREVRRMRDSSIELTDWIVMRHRDELDIGGETTLTAQEFAEVLAYRSALRNFPKTLEYVNLETDEIVWPTKPECIK